jgi:hypothetical protein
MQRVLSPYPAKGELVMSAPLAPERPRPWYRHPLGLAYLLILGLVATAALFATIVPVGGPKADKAVILMVLYAAVDVLMLVPLAFWAFGRGFLRLTRYPAADLLLGLVLVAAAEAALVIFLFVVCLNAAPGR